MLASFHRSLGDVSTIVFGRCGNWCRYTGTSLCLPTLVIFDTTDACVRFCAVITNSEYTANITIGEASSSDTSSSCVEETCQCSTSTSTKAFGKQTKSMDSISALV